MYYRFITKGEWEKQRKSLLTIERKCFKKGDRTIISVFKELIDDIDPFTLIVRDGRKPIGYFMCAPLEESGNNLKRWDKNFGKNNTLYIFSIGVVPEYRNAGIGRGMMNKLIRHAHKDYDRITLHTRNPEFHSMCLKYGFRDVKKGRLENCNMTYMARWLR